MLVRQAVNGFSENVRLVAAPVVVVAVLPKSVVAEPVPGVDVTVLEGWASSDPKALLEVLAVDGAVVAPEKPDDENDQAVFLS